MAGSAINGSSQAQTGNESSGFFLQFFMPDGFLCRVVMYMKLLNYPYCLNFSGSPRIKVINQV